MKKNFIFGLFALVTMLFTASCAEEQLVPNSAGNTATVSFKVSTPVLSTRAVGDGTTASKLYVAVYENQNGTLAGPLDVSLIDDGETVAFNNRVATVNLALAKNKEYSVIFWAETENNGEAMFDIDWTNRKLTLKQSLKANQEKYDAFWAQKTVNISENLSEEVKLTRPFSQLNIGTSDKAAAQAAGVVVENTQIVVEGAYTTFNLQSGEATDEATVTYAMEAIDGIKDENFPAADQSYLSLNYLLMNGDKSTVDVTFSYEDFEDEDAYTLNFNSVPVQRNYRTNIYGTLLTNSANYTVEILPGFEGSYNPEDMLKDALTNGGKFTLLSDMTWPEGFTIPEGKNVEIDLNDNTLTIDTENKVKGNLSINNGNVVVDIEEDGDLLPAFTAYNGAKVDLNNANINLAGKNALVVVANREVAATINVNKTTITGASGAVTHGISMPSGAKDIKINITESTLTSDYALYLYATNSVVTIDDKSLVKDFWIMGGKVDIAYTGTKPEVKMDGLAAEVNFYSQNEYPLHAAIAKGGEITLTEDVVLTQPIALAAGVEATLNLNGKTISGNWSKDNGAVIKNYGSLKLIGGTVKSTADNGGSALQNNGTAILEGTTLNGAPNANAGWPSYTVNKIGTLTLNNSKITSYHGAVASYGDNAVVTLNDCVIDMTGIPGFTSHGIYTYNNGKVIVNGGTYENKATDQAASGASVINGRVEVNAGTFNGRIENYYGTPVLKGGTYSAKPNDKYIANGYKAIEKDGKWYVVANDVNTIVSNDTELKAAFDAGYTTINMKAGTYDTKNFQVVGKTINLKGIEEGVKIYNSQNNDVASTSFDMCTVTFENLTIETLGGNYKGFARMNGTYKNCTIVNNYFTCYGKHLFENCTFNAPALTGLFKNEHCVWTYGAEEVDFVDCTFNYSDRCVNVYVDNGGNAPGITSDVAFTNCVFNTENDGSEGAVEVNSTPFTAGVKVVLKDCTAPAYGEMVYVSPWDGNNGANATITVDGVEVAK